MTIRAFTLIKIKTGDLRAAVCDLRRIPLVDEANLTFGPYDIIATLHAADLQELGRVVAREIQTIPGVLETRTCIMVDPQALEDIQVASYPE